MQRIALIRSMLRKDMTIAWQLLYIGITGLYPIMQYVHVCSICIQLSLVRCTLLQHLVHKISSSEFL